MTVKCSYIPDDKTETICWQRGITDTLFPADTTVSFYFDMPALRPLKQYMFIYNIERYATPKEANALNGLFAPDLRSDIDNIYEAYSFLQDTNNLIYKQCIVSDTTSGDLRPLIDHLTYDCYYYYYDRNITVSRSLVKHIIEGHIGSFLNYNFISLLESKKSTSNSFQKYAEDDVYNQVKIVHETTVLNSLFKNFNKFTYKASAANVKPKSFVLQSSFYKLIHSFSSLDPDFLENAIYLRNNKGDSVFWKDRLPSSELQTRLQILSNVIDSTKKLIFFIDTLSNDGFFSNPSNIRGGIIPDSLKRLRDNLYDFFRYCDALKGKANNYISATKNYENAFVTAKFDFRGAFPFVITVPGMTSGEFVTRGQWIVNADVGMATRFFNDGARYPEYHDITPYYGVNFNLVPINLQRHYSIIDVFTGDHGGDFEPYSRGELLLRSVTVVFGITLSSISDPNRVDLFPSTVSKSLLTGGGIRLTDAFRLSCGTVWSFLKNPNPLINSNSLKGDLYLSASLDFNLFQWLGGFGKNVPGY